jgi:hypothetical protein
MLIFEIINPIQNPVVDPKEGVLDIVKANPLAFFFVRLWQTIVILGGIALILFLVWGAIEWIMSEGDKEKLTKARNKITNAIIGLALLVLSYAIVLFLKSVFGLDLLQLKWPTP